MEMKVLLLRSFFENDLQYIKNKLYKGIEIITPPSFDEDTLSLYAREADVFLGATLTESLLINAKKLKFVQVPWTGVDNLNFELLNKFNITVCNSHSNAGVVAEHAIALMFDAAKKITYHDKLLREGVWNRPSKENNPYMSPFSKKIFGSSIGILGFGAIGKSIACYLKGFECKITAYNTNGQGKHDLVSFAKLQNSYGKLSEHDFLFIALALTTQTRGLIDNTILGKLKQDAVLINVSRGEVINENDLFVFLEKHSDFIACLDTWYQYPTAQQQCVSPSKKNEFHLLDNIIMSPHRAGMVSGELPHLDDVIENLNRCFRGESLINIISYKNRY